MKKYFFKKNVIKLSIIATMSSSYSTSRLIVGTPEWLATKNYESPTKSYSNYECDKKSIPVEFKTTGNTLIKMKKLQNKMMDNGWRLCEGDEGEKDYFIHPTYPDTKFPAFKQVIGDSTIILPIVDMDVDTKGLGCSFEVKPGMSYCNIKTNEFISYWNTREGKRKAKYHDYLDRREDKKKQIEEEEAEILKTKAALSSNL